MRFEDDIDDAELLELMDAPTVPRSAGDGSRGTNATPAAEAPAVATAAPEVDPALASSLTATLKKFFGHDAFRAGQLDVVAAAVSGRDAAVYWSTGSGKSMCYQVPALHTGRTTLVVSPLVSLMQDQVTHLNNTAGEGRAELAAFLGSAQSDPSVQERALRGDFAVLYVTPEKLVGFVDDDDLPKKSTEPTYFVRRLQEMVEAKTLGLVAVDEAHCVSQWGHDFRAAYRALDALRLYLAPNGEVPLMALTATAVSAVRDDIDKVLGLRTPFVAVNSCDRPNLRVRVAKKRGAETDFKFLADAARDANGSVIVYCPSVRETEAVCEALRAKFGQNASVGVYHARLSPAQRKKTHMDFLVGAVKVVAATVAFGMGIDKPDIRLVVHYGAPKTMEEYYQQVGRAGRDGLPSECLMLYGDNDFVKYASDFYVGKLSQKARETQKKSTDALERFARDARGCRRAGILRHFGETTPNTWRPAPRHLGDATSAGTSRDNKPLVPRRVCGTCDACSRLFESAASGKALEAEYTLECAPVLMAVARGFPGSGASMTHVVALATDSNPPANGRAPAAGVRELVRAARLALAPTARSLAFVKEITRALAENGYLRAVAVKSEYGSYEVFQTTPQGVAVANAAFEVFASDDRGHTQNPKLDAAARREAALAALARRAPGARVILPVPESLARAEADAKAAADAKVLELETAGVDTSAIPAAELEAGSGPALNAELQWARAIAKLRQSGDDAKRARANAMAELLRRVERWRDSTAEKLGMAPASVFASFVAKRVAYTCASGGHLDVESLRSAGVRVAGADGLAAELKSAAAELGLARETFGGAGEASDKRDASDKRMRLASFAPVTPWPFAVYKPRKKKGCPDEPPPWETSWRRFAGGEAPAAIALTQPSGRAVQVTTVVGHLLEALTQGRTVDFKRLGSFEGLADRFPTEREWRAMDDAADETAQDPAGDPASFSQRELLRGDALLGAEAVDVDRELKSEKQRAAEASWYDKIRVYVALRRAGVEPEWDDADEAAPDAKRARTNHR